MCDILLGETTKVRSRPRHPGLPPLPPRKTPVFYVVLIGSQAQGGYPHPMFNDDIKLDDVTWGTLPAEFVKVRDNLTMLLDCGVTCSIGFFAEKN